MTDALAIRNEQQGSAIAPVDIAAELPQIFRLASALIKATGFIPSHLKNEGEIAAVILAGRELGLQPMVSLRSIAMVKGKPVLAADVMLGLMLRAGVKHEWVSDGSPAQGNVARIRLERPGHEPYVSSFSLEDAQRAGLASNDNYKKHQGAMLRARAVSAGGRAYCPDVLSGCYVPGELGEEETPAPAPRASKPRRDRTLDDVAQSRESSAIAAGMSDHAQDAARHEDEQRERPTSRPPPPAHDADGVVPSTDDLFQQHLVDLGQCAEPALLPWRDHLLAMPLTDAQKSKAWRALVKRCGQLNVDVAQFEVKS